MSIRHEFVEKDGIRITYTGRDVCFEDMATADSILIANDGSIVHNNFDKERTDCFEKMFQKIYATIQAFRDMDAAEEAC